LFVRREWVREREKKLTHIPKLGAGGGCEEILSEVGPACAMVKDKWLKDNKDAMC
jgi:hypothetical protein